MTNSVSELNSAINTASTVKLPMLFASIAVTLLFALLAAFPAARYASHVSPTVAMSGQAVKIKRKVKRNRKIRKILLCKAQPETWVRKNNSYHSIVGYEYYRICCLAELYGVA